MNNDSLPIYVYPTTKWHGGNLTVKHYVFHLETPEKLDERLMRGEVSCVRTIYGFIHVNTTIPDYDIDRIKCFFEEAYDKNNIYRMDGMFVQASSIVDRYLQDKLFPSKIKQAKNFIIIILEIIIEIMTAACVLYWFNALDMRIETESMFAMIFHWILIFISVHGIFILIPLCLSKRIRKIL